MKCLWFLFVVLFLAPVTAETDDYSGDEDNEYSDNDMESFDEEEELPDFDFSMEEDGAGLSMVTSVNGNTVVYGRVFYNYISNYSLGRIYIYEQTSDTDEFELTGQIPDDKDRTNYFGGFVAMSENTIFTLDAIYGNVTFNEKQLDIYKENEESGWQLYKTVDLPENYKVAENSGFAADNGTILFVAYNSITGNDNPEIFVYSPDDDYTSFKSLVPENFDKDAYSFSFPKGFDISENTIIATSTSMTDEFTKGPTRIHIFTKNSESGEWEETQTIKSEQTDHVKAYYNISISGDNFIVHSYLDDSVSISSVQIFEKKEGNWELVKELLPEDVRNHFGYNVSIGEEFAVATDKGDSKSLPFGTTYVFHRDYDPENPEVKLENNWGLFEKYEVTDESVAPLMGSVAVIDGDTLSMGAAPSILKSDSGLSAYIEKLKSPEFSETPDGEENPDEGETINDESELNDESETADESEINDMETTDDDVSKETENNESEGSGCLILFF